MVFTVRFMLGIVVLLIACVPIHTSASWRNIREVQLKQVDKPTNDSTKDNETIQTTLKTTIPDNVTRKIVQSLDASTEDNVASATATKPKTETKNSDKPLDTNKLDINSTSISSTKPTPEKPSTQKHLFETESQKDAIHTTQSTTEKKIEEKKRSREERKENSRSLDIDIDKYTSEQFHNKNNVYNIPISEENKKFISTEFADFRESSHSSTESYKVVDDFSVELTTSNTKAFDSIHRKIQEGVKQNLGAVDDDFKSVENSFENSPSKDFKVEDLIEKAKSPDASLEYHEFKKLHLNNSIAKNKSKHEDVSVESGTKIKFNSTFSDTKVIDEQNIIPIVAPDSEEIKSKEIENSASESILRSVSEKPFIENEEPAEDPKEKIETESNALRTEKNSITKPPKISNTLLSNKIETDNVKPTDNSKVKYESTTTTEKHKLTFKSFEENRDKLGTLKSKLLTNVDASHEEFLDNGQGRSPKINDKHYNETKEQSVQENQIFPIKVLPTTTTLKIETTTVDIKESTTSSKELETSTAVETSTEIRTESESTTNFPKIETTTVLEITSTANELSTQTTLLPPDLGATLTTLINQFDTTENEIKTTTYMETTSANVENMTTTEEITETTDFSVNTTTAIDMTTTMQSFSFRTDPTVQNEIVTTTSSNFSSFSHVVDLVENSNTTNTTDAPTKIPDLKQEDNQITDKTPEQSTTKPILTTTSLDTRDNTVIITNNELPVVQETTTKRKVADTTTNHYKAPAEDLKESSENKPKEPTSPQQTSAEVTTELASFLEIEADHAQNISHFEDSQENRPNLLPTTTSKEKQEHLTPRNDNKNVDQVLTSPKDGVVDSTTLAGELEVPEDEEEGTNGTVIAIIISSVGAVCLILLVGLLYIMRKRQKRFNYPQMCKPVDLDSYNMDNVSVYNSVRRKAAMRASKRSYGNPAFDDPAMVSRPLNFQALAKYTNQEDIKKEFDEIPQVTARTNELPEGCEVKNRYANVIPLPESRVFLKEIEGQPNSDYINANYVTGAKSTKGYYIACQAPLSNTVDDFWRMVWEQQSKVILMLTHLYENGVEKCTDYLPPSEVVDCHRLFGDFQVTLKKRDVKDKYIISTLQLKNMVSNSWREVTHLWYLGWPEKGVPQEANSLIAFLIEARSFIKSSAQSSTNESVETTNGDIKKASGRPDTSPVIVHCSPGTGRSGTVIACDIAIREFEQTRQVDIPRIVYRIRRDRASSVQTREQYAFIYKVITLYATKLTGGALDSL